VPSVKVNGCAKNLSVDDFRSKSISSAVISKIFEHCILSRISRYFVSSDNQFCFKKAVRCLMLFIFIYLLKHHNIAH